VETIIHDGQRGNDDRNQHWARLERADLFERYSDLQAQGISQRQAAKVLDVPRSTLQAWRVYQGASIQARDQDIWKELMEQALVGLSCKVIQSTSDEAPGLLAYVEHHLGAHHSPDVCHVQHELHMAVSAPIAAKQRAAHKAATKSAAS
jgi:hypothetical protein